MARLRNRISGIIVCAALLLPAVALARPGRGGPDPEPRSRVRTYLVLRIAEELDLSEEKALELSRALRKVDQRREELERKRRDVEDRLRRALEGAEGDSQLNPLIDEALKIDRELALLPQRGIEDAMDLLTPEQRARLVLFQPQLRKEVRRAVRRRLQRRPPPQPLP